ncbi:hypothetical protein FQR65_LT14608 [Abscondita terminalis]|nr:hypothetical protein FQR65_LT14608 [Abscondita terminalis]
MIVKWRLLWFRSDVEKPRRVLLVTAHPDDECMFFGPTIINLTRNRDCTVYLMCLSKGANYGKVRKNELYKACQVLGLRESCIVIQSHTLLPDSMTEKWPVDLIADIVLDQVVKYGIDTLITFDKHGVSQHLNHCSIYYAVTYLLTECNLPKECKVYVLETINVLRKYWLILDIPICYILSRHRYILSTFDYNVVKTAMKQHQSQLVWFRRLYLLFSRYIMINTLQRVELSDLELEIELDD